MKAFARYQIILLGEQRHIGVNNLPKVVLTAVMFMVNKVLCVARQRSGRESNPRPLDQSRVRPANHYTTKQERKGEGGREEGIEGMEGSGRQSPFYS